jgi:hypothetical protein
MMSGIVMQALVPVSQAAAEFMQARTNGKNLFIGVDPAIAVGHTSVLATTALMVPVMIILAFIVPGTLSVPLADLPALLFFWVFAAAPNKGDMLRTFITTVLMGLIATVSGIFIAPWADAVAKLQGVENVTGATSTFLYSARICWFPVSWPRTSASWASSVSPPSWSLSWVSAPLPPALQRQQEERTGVRCCCVTNLNLHQSWDRFGASHRTPPSGRQLYSSIAHTHSLIPPKRSLHP